MGKRAATRGPRIPVEWIRRTAGPAAFGRGEVYFDEGRVRLVANGVDRILAQVVGTETYRCELKLGERIEVDCTCPAFEDAPFCKHLVATALAANAAGEPGEAVDESEPVRQHLRALGVDALADMVMSLALEDDILMRKLQLRAAEGDDRELYARYKEALDAAVDTGEYVDYGAARHWVRGVDEILDEIATLPDKGRPAVARDLALHLLELIEEMFESIDDSDGHLGELAERARRLHIEACRLAPPDPAELANILFEYDMDSNFVPHGGSAAAYEDILGATGIAEYRKRVEKAWAALAPATPKKRGEAAYDPNRFQLAAILDGFAKRAGDVDARLAIAAKDLSSPDRYIRIAELCREHGRDDEALRWAEEGLWAFEEHPDERLRTFVADLYRARGRPAEAEALLWRIYEHGPSFATFERLRRVAADSRATADRSVAFLEGRLASRPVHAPAWGSGDADLIVSILLAERRLDEAWAAARRHRCSDTQLQRLARASEETLPDDAIGAYAELIEQKLRHTNQQGYVEACDLIKSAGKLRHRAGRAPEHAAHVEDIARRHKMKRNFIKLLRALPR